MRVELTEIVWFEDHVLSLSELASLSGLSAALLSELISAGAIAPLQESAADPRFGGSALRLARRARRLREDFELDAQALLVSLGLLERIDALESELHALRVQLPRRLR